MNKLLILYFKNLLNVKQIKSPPSSPDLNPIEWVWHDLKQFVRKCRCTSEKEIIQACLEFQNKISAEYCQKYINKLREVVQIVIKKKGEQSNY